MKISASLICADPLNLKKDLTQLYESCIDSIHFDVMDGNFVPRYGLYPEIIKAIRKDSNICIDVHMMTNNPEKYIQDYSELGVDYYSFHIEATNHADHLVNRIISSGMKAGIAINPSTTLSTLEYLVDKVDLIVLMAINPGVLGQKINNSIYNKIKSLKELAINKGNPDLIIQIDGGVTFETAPILIQSGANSLVCGTGTIFRPTEDIITNKVNALRKILNR
jgi:ribulose-phosphate 3-epimerase